MNKCIACGLDFKSVTSFDQHRIFGEKDNWKTRRCLTAEELKAKGFEPDRYNRWRIPMPGDVVEIRARVL